MTVEYFEKYLHILCYSSEEARAYVAANILTHSGEIFKRTKCIVDRAMLEDAISNRTVQIPVNEIMEFVFESIIDKIRIITCFENYMKAVLLENGYVVHNINGIIHKQFKSDQANLPVKIADIFTTSSFQNIDQKAKKQQEVIETTLKFSTLLKPAYTKVVGLSANIITDLREINNERNKLHLTSTATFEWGGGYTERYDRIEKYFNETIYPTILNAYNKNLSFQTV